MKNPPDFLRESIKDRGFALVVTLSLMILLTIIAVGLLTLSSISLRSATNSSAMSEARQNARIALMLAIGELQKHVGQDQRVTATADIAGMADGSLLADGAQPANTNTVNGLSKGLSSVQPGTRHWTGVWKNSNLVAAGTTTPGVEIFTKTPSPTQLQWLISGNDAGANPAITPSSTAFSVKADGSVADPKTAVVLVGPHSVGNASAATLQSYVSAPLVSISTKKSGSSNPSGRYAWWIGDEGVKAKFNRSAPGSTNQPTTYETLANQRAGWEVVTGLQNYPTPGSAAHDLLVRVATLQQGEILDPSLNTAVGDPRALFHSATTDSLGVIADVLQGGLRVDLSATLAKGLPATSSSTFPNSPAKNKNIIPTSVIGTNNLKGPKWDLLAAFYNQAKSITGDKLTVKTASGDTDLTIAPIIVDLRLLFGVKMVAIDASTYRIHPCGKIAISIANPYPYTLEWKNDLEFQMIDDTPPENGRDSRVWEGAGACAFFSNKGEPAVFNNATFLIPKGELEPGEARAFTMAAPVTRRAGTTTAIKVDLKPFSSSSPSNFSNCILQEENATNTGSKSLDVREIWTTTQVSAELRLGGGSGSNVLCRIERFELDNGFFGSLRRGVTSATAGSMRQPFPLHSYSFQLSQPGADYATLLPSRDLLGTRSSTLRSFADFNLRATRFSKPITSYNPPPYFMESSDSLASLPFLPPGGDTGSAFTKNLAVSPLYWGRAPNAGVKQTILFSFPETLTSLAQLQHADLTADDQWVSISQQPGNAVGNSYATPFVRRKLTIQSRDNYTVTGAKGGENQTASKETRNYYDMSYLLNAALWDTCFFSSIEGTSGSAPLNQSIIVLDKSRTGSALNDPANASSHLMIDGAFNINSTNKDAWKALLAGNRFLKHPADAAAGVSTDALFPRSLEQTSPGLSSPTGSADDSFSGFRRLSNQQIDAVAEEIVKQVRLRGPFVSLSHFVNRALVDLTARSTTNPLSRSGALQSALDNSGANISPDGTKSAFSKALNVSTDKVILQAEAGSSNAPKADLWGTQPNGSRGATYGGKTDEGLPVWASESKDLNPGSVASIVADRIMLTDSNLKNIEQGYRSTGIPGWITQADVLQAIGPSIAARSDTFRIRTYGEALSPDGQTVVAKAWCEAVVQRLPGYVDQANAPSDRMASPGGSSLSKTNQLFGRKFEIVSFRWLAQNEI